MNKDEILAKSRKENENGDEMSKQLHMKAASISRTVGFLLCVLGVFIDRIMLKNGIVGLFCWSVYWGMRSAEDWVVFAGFKFRTGCVKVVVNTLLFVVFTVLFVIRLVEVV